MKAYSAAAKRRAKKGRTGVRELYKQFETMQDAMQAIDKQEDPRQVVQDARARMMGRKSAPELLSARMCEPAGMAITIGAPNDAEVLWRAFVGYDSAEQTYFRRIIGRPRFPNVAKLEHMPNSFEARPDDRPDLRSSEEKDRDAANTWAKWQGYILQLPAFQRQAITRASWQMDELHKGPDLTVHGEAFVAAIRALAGIIEAG